MKNILLIATLFALSGCAGMELSSVSVGVGVGHYQHYPYGHRLYDSHYYPHYYQRPVIIHRHTVRPRPHHVAPRPHHNNRPQHQRDHRRGDRRQNRH